MPACSMREKLEQNGVEIEAWKSLGFTFFFYISKKLL